jgi:DNA polymerase
VTEEAVLTPVAEAVPKLRRLDPSVDFEFRSGTDIKLGLARYFADPEAAVLCMAFVMAPDAMPEVWTPTTLLSFTLHDLLEHVRNGGRIRGWNVFFEYCVWNQFCVPLYGWPELKLEQCVDSMAEAAALNLPQSLDKCAIALKLSEDKLKSKRGKELIKLLCCPQEPPEVRAPERYKRPGDYKSAQTRYKHWEEKGGRWINDPALLQELYDYCRQDVVAEVAVSLKMKPLSKYEQRVWVQTHIVNMRGIPVDAGEVQRIADIVAAEVERLNEQMALVTSGAVESGAARDQFLAWVNEQAGPQPKVIEIPGDEEAGEPARLHTTYEPLLPDAQKETIERALLSRATLPAQVVRALEIRAAVAQTSTAKLASMSARLASDGTLKGMYVYHGASTGRDASRGGVNVQNLASPTLTPDQILEAFEIFGTGDHSLAHMMYGDGVMDAAVSLVRGVIKCPEGYTFYDADFSSVENRFSAWIAGQDDKLELFRTGLDEYKTFASRLFGIPYEEVTKEQRKRAKPPVLGCFGAGTRVRTLRGPVRIDEVMPTDRIWDGQEWVQHGGVVDQGYKSVINFIGLRVTPEHLILSDEGWQRADSVEVEGALMAGRDPSRFDISGPFLTREPVRSRIVAEVRTYDILNCGPRNRFTVVTDAGPIIAHNCMFGLGAQGYIDYAAGFGMMVSLPEAQEAVDVYRREYFRVQAAWYRLGDISIQAVQNPGVVFDMGRREYTDWKGRVHCALPFGKLRLVVVNNFLFMQLPSGRKITWAAPLVEHKQTPWGAMKDVVTVMQVDAVTTQWRRDKLIGSSIFQSGVQASARDALIHGSITIEEAGYPVVMRTHDELTAQVKVGFGSPDEMGRLMCIQADWYKDLPVAYEAWESRRFRK